MANATCLLNEMSRETLQMPSGQGIPSSDDLGNDVLYTNLLIWLLAEFEVDGCDGGICADKMRYRMETEVAGQIGRNTLYAGIYFLFGLRPKRQRKKESIYEFESSFKGLVERNPTQRIMDFQHISLIIESTPWKIISQSEHTYHLAHFISPRTLLVDIHSTGEVVLKSSYGDRFTCEDIPSFISFSSNQLFAFLLLIPKLIPCTFNTSSSSSCQGFAKIFASQGTCSACKSTSTGQVHAPPPPPPPPATPPVSTPADMQPLPNQIAENIDLSAYLTEYMFNIKKPARQRRWSKITIHKAMQLWIRGGETAYLEMQTSFGLLLPSIQLMRKYKNGHGQKPGFNFQFLQWMSDEASSRSIQNEDYIGGLAFDEMSIKEDLQFESCTAQTEFVGLVDLGEESKCRSTLKHGAKHEQSAKYILQFIFAGMRGFRWPCAYFPTACATATDIYDCFMKGVDSLFDWNFKVRYACMDGSENNRTFIKIIFKTWEQAVQSNFTTINPSTPSSTISFIMDPPHNFKKIRNSLLKRKLFNDKPILWKFIRRAWEWDQQNNKMRYYSQLTRAHIFPDQGEKMRNSLATMVLDKKMLKLMEHYQHSLPLEAREELEATIIFLKNTSVLVRNFNTDTAIRSINNKIFEENREVLEYFTKWHQLVDPDKFISVKCFQDLQSMILGFNEFCVKNLPEIEYVVPARLSTDVVENHFCSQRSKMSGANTNPTSLQYATNNNSIIVSQTAISKHSNAGAKLGYGAMPPKLSNRKS